MCLILELNPDFYGVCFAITDKVIKKTVETLDDEIMLDAVNRNLV